MIIYKLRFAAGKANSQANKFLTILDLIYILFEMKMRGDLNEKIIKLNKLNILSGGEK